MHIVQKYGLILRFPKNMFLRDCICFGDKKRYMIIP